MNTSLPEWSWWKGVLRSEVCRLMERGSVTLDEYQALRCNGIETELIAPHLTNEAFVEYAERRLANVTYDPQQFIGFTVPELIKRLRATLERLANHDRMHLSYDVDAQCYQVGDIRVSVNVLEDARATALQDYRKSNGALFQSRDEAEKAAWRDHAIQTIRQHRLAHPDTTPAEDYAEKAAATSMYLSEPDVTPTTTDGSR